MLLGMNVRWMRSCALTYSMSEGIRQICPDMPESTRRYEFSRKMGYLCMQIYSEPEVLWKISLHILTVVFFKKMFAILDHLGNPLSLKIASEFGGILFFYLVSSFPAP